MGTEAVLTNNNGTGAAVRGASEVDSAESLRLRALAGLLLGVTTGFLVGAVLEGGFKDGWGLLRGHLSAVTALELGALAPWPVTVHELDRVLTSAFVHGGVGHWFLNVSALLLMGRVVAGACGSAGLVLVFSCSLLGGHLATLGLSNELAVVGASSGAYGIFGALAVLDWLHPQSLPPAIQGMRSIRLYALAGIVAWELAALLGTALSLWSSSINHLGHIGGLVVGVLSALLLVGGRDPATLREHPPLWLRPAAIGMLTLFSLALGTSLYRTLTSGRAGVFAAFDAWLATGEASPERVNQVAWLYAITPDIDRSSLLQARDAMLRAGTAERGVDPHRLDTLATLEFRLGAPAKAVTLESRVLEELKGREYASQLARFGLAQLDGPGSLASGSSVPKASVRLEANEGSARTLELSLEHPPSSGMTLYAVLLSKRSLEGLLRIRLGPTTAASWSFDDNRSTLAALPDETDLRIFLVEDGSSGLDADSWSWRIWRMDRQVEELPGPEVHLP